MNHTSIKMPRPIVLALLALGLLGMLSLRPGADPRPARIGEYLSGQAGLFRFNGNVLVAERGKVIFQKSYGYADFDTRRLLNDSSVFELASVSKQFTATAILLLADQGKLKLSDSLRQYFPELPYPGISIHQMLTHTSGLPDYEEPMIEKWDHGKIAFNVDMIAFLAREKPAPSFAPGSRWEYSNTAYAILASIVEKVSGESFASFLSRHIFKPLGMRHTRIYNTRRSLRDTIANYAYGYQYQDSLQKYLLPDSMANLRFVHYLDGIQGDGVVNSTTADLLLWDRAIKSRSLLSETMHAEMLRNQALVDTAQQSFYGYGVFREKTDLGSLVSHSGGWPGYTTFLARNIDHDQTLIVLSNNASNSPAIAKAIHHILHDKPVIMPYLHREIALDSLSLQAFAGTYRSTQEMGIRCSDGKLYRTFPNGRKMELRPESANRFFYADGSDRQIEFVRDVDQKVSAAILIQYGLKTDFQKLD